MPASLLVAIWTLESDNGTGDMGKLPVIRTLATLAHDCRRTELFQGELIAALTIVQRGDLPLRDLIGAYAGEIGQTQFLPQLLYQVRRRLRRQRPCRSAAFRAGCAGLDRQSAEGQRLARGAPFGEGTANFEAMREWNRSEVYRKTMVLMAERIAE